MEFIPSPPKPPNPSSGKINIVTNANPQDLELKIFNSAGTLISENHFHSESKIELNLEGPIGLYIVQVSSPQDQVSFRVLKN